MHLGNARLIDALLTTAEKYKASIQRSRYLPIASLYCTDEWHRIRERLWGRRVESRKDVCFRPSGSLVRTEASTLDQAMEICKKQSRSSGRDRARLMESGRLQTSSHHLQI